MSNPLSPVSSDFNVFLRENPSVYFNSTTPAAPGGNTNVTFQFDQFGNVSAYAPTGSGGITALTGDVTASGSGSVASTLATVNSNVGSFTNANVTVNAKGLVTAAANGAAGATIPSVTNLISGNGSGNGADSGVAAANVALLNGASQVFSGTGGIAATNGVTGGVAGSSGNVFIHNQGGFPAVDGQGTLLIRSTGGSNPILLQPATSTSVELYASGGTYFGTSGFADPGANNVIVQGNVKAAQYTATIATIAAATTIAPVTPFVNLTGTTAIVTITLPSGVSSTVGTTITFFPASTVATTTAGNIAAIYSLIGGKAYQAVYNGTSWFFIGSGI